MFLFYKYGSITPIAQVTAVAEKKLSTQLVTAAAVTHSSVAKAPQEKVELVDEELTEQFSVVANTYADELQYPPYSLPLTISDRQLLQPNAYNSLPLPLENGASATIELDAYRFIYPQPVLVRLRLHAIHVYDVSWKLIDEMTNKELDFGEMQSHENGFQTTLRPEKNWDGPVRIEIEFKHGSQAQTVQTGFEYSQPVAKIIGVGSTSTEAADLIIPVKLNVIRAGTYRLRANLFDVNRKPLAVLSTTERLSSGETRLKLRAYKAVLEGAVGPLWIGTFQLENRSASPGEPTRYGDSEEEGYSVNYTGNEIFSDEIYQPDEEERQRLEFLQQMAEQRQ